MPAVSRFRTALVLLLMLCVPLQGYAAAAMLSCGLSGHAHHAAAAPGDGHDMPCHDGKTQPPSPCAGCMQCIAGTSMAPPAPATMIVVLAHPLPDPAEILPPLLPDTGGPFRPPRRSPA